MYPLENQGAKLEELGVVSRRKRKKVIAITREENHKKFPDRLCPVCESPAIFQTGSCFTCYICGNSSGCE